MKKFLSYFVLMFCCVATVSAQQTSLVVDNQTPGWLSSKIPFADQATLKNLKVTGYLNGTDIKFIRELTETRELVHLDLSEANIVSGGDAYYSSYKTKDNMLGSYMFSFATSKSGTFLSLPKSVTNVDGLCDLDTLVVGSTTNNIIQTRPFYRKDIEDIYFRDGVDSIEPNADFEPSLRKVHLPSTLRSIGERTFDGTEGTTLDINITNSIIYMGHLALGNYYLSTDTIRLPNKMQVWETCAFNLRENQVVYIPESIKTIDNSCGGSNINQYTKLHLFVDNPIPPTFKGKIQLII